MSKELPYFKFNPSEWFEGDITLENEKTQGLFILICAWYWKKDCVIDIAFVNKRLIKGKTMLKQCLNILIDKNIIKVSDSQRIIIEFLDEQYDELSELRQKKVEAGRKGGKASVKHRLSNKDKDINKDKDEDIDIVNISFEDFWNLYDKKRDRPKCEKRWNNLKDIERVEIIEYLPAYVKSTPDKTFRKDPAVFLNNRSWENEIIKPEKTKSTGYNPDQWK